MTGVLLALAASLAWGCSDFSAGLASRRTAVPLVVAGVQAAGLALVGGVALAAGAQAPAARELAWGAAAGVFGALGLAAFYRALAIGAMGIVGPISATAVVVPVAYGLVLGNRPSPLQGAGIALAFAGVVAASLERVPQERRRLGAGVPLALVAALGFGGSLTALNRASQAGAVWATLSLRLAALPLVLAAALALRPPLAGLARNLPLIVAAGAIDTTANLLYGLSSRHGLLSVVSVLASLYPVVLVVLARVLLAERIPRPQLAGVAVTLAGVALVTAG